MQPEETALNERPFWDQARRIEVEMFFRGAQSWPRVS
jgi:hypothetical protein